MRPRESRCGQRRAGGLHSATGDTRRYFRSPSLQSEYAGRDRISRLRALKVDARLLHRAGWSARPTNPAIIARSSPLRRDSRVRSQDLATGRRDRSLDDFVHLLYRMLDYNDATRITAAQALRHPFFNLAKMPGPPAR